jgi:hypothetical protein
MEKKTVIIEVQTEDGVKQLDRLSAKFDEVYGDVLPLTASIGELEDQLYQMALEGQKGTKEFNLLAAEAGRLKKTLQQVDSEVDGLSMTTANKLGGALGGVTAGFELAQGAMGAMGVESEKIQEALLKVQSAMAIAQGVQGLKESVPVFKAIGAAGKAAFTGIRGAILATGIGALIVGVGLLISNWDKVTEVTKKAADAGKQMVGDFASKYPKTFKAVKTYLEWAFMPILLAYKGAMMLYDALTGTTEASRKAGEVAEQNHKKHIKQLDQEQKARDENLKGLDRKIALLEAEGKSTIKLREEKIRLQKQEAEANLAFAQYMKGRMKGNEIFEQSFSDMVSVAKDSLNNIEVEEKKLSREKKEINKQNTDNYKSNLDKQKSDLAEKNQAEKEAIKALYDEEQRLNQERIAKEDAQFQLERSLTETKQEQEIQDLIASYDEKFSIAEGNAELEKQLQEKQKTEIAEINNRYLSEVEEAERLAREKKDKADEEQAAKELARKKQLASSSLEATKSGLQGISDIIGAFAGKSKAQQKKAFEAQKKLNIAMATIDTIKGAVSAFTGMTASIPGPIGLALGAVAAAGVVASGVANVKKISSTQFDAGGSPSASTSGGGAGGSGAPNLPSSQPAQFNVVGNSGTNQLNGIEKSSPVKAYVVSGDVTSAQSLERNKIATATL